AELRYGSLAPREEKLDAIAPRQHLLQGIRALQKTGIEFEFLSGAVGGPLVVGFLTPNRNAMTLAAKDTTSSVLGLYRQVFMSGPKLAFRGGSTPTMAAVPQFTMIGPCYLAIKKKTGSQGLAVFGAAFGETLLTFGAQRRNAQIQFNAVRHASEHIAVDSMARSTGPGFGFHVWRNMVAMMGIRIFAPYTLKATERIPGLSGLSQEGRHIAADFGASTIAAMLSMPFNQVFSWAVCTPATKEMSQRQRLQAYSSFLIGNYQAKGVRLLARDLVVRIFYTGILFTGYHGVERRMSLLSSEAMQ
ncbi:unnamed protein product, partial [Polarella glacialis]